MGVWEEGFFPGVTLDDLAGLADFPVIRPVAGGAPGILDEFEDAWAWAKRFVVDPISGSFRDVGKAILDAVVTGITGFFSMAGWWVYRFCDAVFRYGSLNVWRQKFPHYNLIKGLSPWYYLHKVGHMFFYGMVETVRGLFDWMLGQLIAVRNWLLSKVRGLIDWVKGAVEDVVRATTGVLKAGWRNLGQVVEDAAGWVKGAVEDVVRETTGVLKAGWRNLGQVIDDAASWVWGRVEEAQAFFEDGVTKIVTSVAEAVGGGIRKAFEWALQSVFEPFVDLVEQKLAIPGKLIRGEYRSLSELLEEVLDPPREMLSGFTGMLILPLMAVGVVVSMITGLGAPLLEPINQETARLVGARIPAYQVLRDGYLRGELVESVHDEWLGRSGLDEANIALQKALYQQIPGPTDLVRMGVREVFTPAIAERFGQFEDFPPDFGYWMKKQGFDLSWAQSYWAAHWDLPSAMQGFEMFHRDVISEDDLKLLLRALDVMPYWRDKLQAIAYNVITRVDVRRMYQDGVIEADKVERVYLDQGYTPEDAGLLTEWVIKHYPRSGEEGGVKFRENIVSITRQAYARRLITRDAVVDRLRDADYTAEEAELQVEIWDFDFYLDPSLRSDVDPKQVGIAVIERAYERRLVDFNAAVRELGELGYTPEDAKLRLQLVDLKLEEYLADLEIDVALDEYYAGLIGDAELAARLKDLHIPEARVEYLVREQVLRRQAKDKQLTLSQLKRALAARIIGLPEFRFRLDAMGYNARDVEIVVGLEAGAV